MLKLREYQTKLIDLIRSSYLTGHRAPLAVSPTGSGKTVVFAYIAANTAARGKRALILVHRVELLRQTADKLRQSGVQTGLINPKYTPDPTAPVQVASVQTLIKRMHKMNFSPDLIVIDEAHHASAGTWRKICDHYTGARILGVTATPIRSDGKGLGAGSGGIFDDLVEGPQIQDLIDLGFLVRPVVYAPAERLDLSGVRTKMGDYDKKEIEIRVDKPSITGDVIQHYRKLCDGAPAVAFCVSVAHAEHVAQEFRAAGYRAYSVDGSMDDDRRTKLLNGLGNGQVQVLCSCDLISEGTDIVSIGAAILLRPTQSTGLFIQQVGRALRPCAGKDRAIILDHVGNVITHGMPDEVREWSLDGEIKRKKKKKKDEETVRVKQCPECYAMHIPAPKCPECGHVYKTEGRQVDERDGELKQVTAEAAKFLKRQRTIEVAQAKTLEDLIRVGEQRGYKAGWARNVWAARNKKAVGL